MSCGLCHDGGRWTRAHALGAADEPQSPPRLSGARPAFPLAPLPHLPASGDCRRASLGGVPHSAERCANRNTLTPIGVAQEVGKIMNNCFRRGGCVWVVCTC